MQATEIKKNDGEKIIISMKHAVKPRGGKK